MLYIEAIEVKRSLLIVEVDSDEPKLCPGAALINGDRTVTGVKRQIRSNYRPAVL